MDFPHMNILEYDYVERRYLCTQGPQVTPAVPSADLNWKQNC